MIRDTEGHENNKTKDKSEATRGTGERSENRYASYVVIAVHQLRLVDARAGGTMHSFVRYDIEFISRRAIPSPLEVGYTVTPVPGSSHGYKGRYHNAQVRWSTGTVVSKIDTVTSRLP